jgi:hypothetical protein
MNIIKKIMLLTSIVLFAANAIAQTNHYTVTKTFNENGYTYQADVRGNIVVLYNKANQFTGDLKWGFKDGTRPGQDFWSDGIDITTDNRTTTRNQISTIIRNALSTAERQRIGNNELDVTLRINPETGTVFEVEFQMRSNNPFKTIPVSVFRTIELNLKSQLRIPATAKGKRLNYIFRSLDITI